MSDEDDGRGSSGDLRMFAIFIFSLLLLCLIPVTLWRISSGASSEVAVAQPWEKKVCTTHDQQKSPPRVLLASTYDT